MCYFLLQLLTSDVFLTFRLHTYPHFCSFESNVGHSFCHRNSDEYTNPRINHRTAASVRPRRVLLCVFITRWWRKWSNCWLPLIQPNWRHMEKGQTSHRGCRQEYQVRRICLSAACHTEVHRAQWNWMWYGYETSWSKPQIQKKRNREWLSSFLGYWCVEALWISESAMCTDSHPQWWPVGK